MTKAIEKWVERNKEKFQSESEKSHLVDFLKDVYGHKKSINFTYETCLTKAEAWVEKLHKKAAKLSGQGSIKVIHTFPDGYHIVCLLDQHATLWEGSQMGHCVGSHGYAPNTIFSLRDPSGTPHATIEAERGEVFQVKGKGNQHITDKYKPYVVEFVSLKGWKLTMSSFDEVGGLVAVSSRETRAVKKLFSNVKVIKTHAHYQGLYKEGITLKENVNIHDLPLNKASQEWYQFGPTVRDLLRIIDGNTTPEFYLSVSLEKLREVRQKLGKHLTPSVKGYKALFLKDKDKAISIIRQFGFNDRSSIEEKENFFNFMLENGGKKEVINLVNTSFTDSSKRFCEEVLCQWTSRVLTSRNDAEINEALINSIFRSKWSIEFKNDFISSIFNQFTPDIVDLILKYNSNTDTATLNQMVKNINEGSEELVRHVLEKAGSAAPTLKKKLLDRVFNAHMGSHAGIEMSNVSLDSLHMILEGIQVRPEKLTELMYLLEFYFKTNDLFEEVLPEFEKYNTGSKSLRSLLERKMIQTRRKRKWLTNF